MRMKTARRCGWLLAFLGLTLMWGIALAEGADLELSDGTYAPDAFSFSGGTGRVRISCEEVLISGGQVQAKIVFSSPNYGYVKVDGEKYEGEHDAESSTFVVPARLNREFAVVGMTSAMSAPHEIEYTILISLGGSEGIAGLAYESSMELMYAERFSVDYYEGGYALIDIDKSARYLVVPEGKPVPEGLDASIVVLQRPLDGIYVAATAVMSLFDRLDALDCVRFSGAEASEWYVQGAKDAMAAGEMLFAGKYREPDYELLLQEGCDLAIESTMILHTPKVREMIELLGIPVLIDHSSYETHPLGRTEWIKLYGVLTGREERAEAFFKEQAKVIEDLRDFEKTDSTVAFFYISADGSAVVRSTSDYVPCMIEIAGGNYVFDDLTDPESHRSSISLTLEDFYAAAVDADYLIYNTSIDDSISSLDDLLQKSALLSDFKAVREGNVWCTDRYLYQATDIVASLITDIHQMLTGEEDAMTFLYRLQ